MSLRPDPIVPVPEETMRVARAAFPHGNVYMRMRDELGSIYTDAGFAGLFPTHGRPAEAPWRLALITVLQFAEGLSDRQAADAVRSRIDWKYALGLALTDAGFDASVLCEFRARLVMGGGEQQLLDLMLERFRARGLLKARGRQRTDSTHVLAAVRALNRLQCVGETVRHALNALAVAAPDWLRPLIVAEWVERYVHRVDEYRLPRGQAARDALAETMGSDGFRVLDAVYAADAPAWLRELPAVETLRRVWVQQYYARDEDGRIRQRSLADAPPAAVLINSPYDPDARSSAKRDTSWVGYRVHLTETCDDDGPHLVTQVETTPASVQDVAATAPIQDALAAKGLLPSTHIVDAGYIDAALLVSSRTTHGVDLLGPPLPDPSWQAREATGFDVAAFAVDWDARRVTCPEGAQSVFWSSTHDRHGNEAVRIEFAAADCRACPSRLRCTRSALEPRSLGLRPEAQHRALQAARQRQTTDAFKADYARRAGVEGTLSQGVRRCELRRARYVGLAKTRLEHIGIAAALNLVRVTDWLADIPRARTGQAPFARLAASVA